MAAVPILSDEQKLHFTQNGYIVLPGAVSNDLLSPANSLIQDALSASDLSPTVRHVLSEEIPTFRLPAPLAKSSQLTDLFFKANLLEIAEQLLGDDFAVLVGNRAYLDLMPTCRPFLDNQVMPLGKPFPTKRWRISTPVQAKHADKGGGHSLLVSVAMSEDMHLDENRGQIIVWPGSHYTTHAALSEIISDKGPDDHALKLLHANKGHIDCGSPVRVLLHPGDVLVAHQKLGMAAAPNLVDTTSLHVYFRVAHAQVDQIIDQQIASPLPWVGFQGLSELLEEDATDFTINRPKREPTPGTEIEIDDTPVLSREQKEAFIRDGFVILERAIPMEKVRAALDLIDGAYESGQYNSSGTTQPGSKKAVPGFVRPVKQAPEVLELAYGTVLLQAAEDLLGKGHCRIRNKLAQIAYTAQNEQYVEQGMGMKEPHPKLRWHIDAGNGKYAAWGSDFSLLCGVCLSDGQYVDENRGQFNIWVGSHLKTHASLSSVIENTPANDIVRTFYEQKLDVGDPTRSLLHPGDILIAHQRLAHAPGINLSENVRKNVYFRVVDTRLDVLLHDFVKSPTPWVGFDGLSELLPEGATEFEKDLSKKVGNEGLAASSATSNSGRYEVGREFIETFVREGYVVLPGLVSQELVAEALNDLDKAYEKGRYHQNGKKRIGSSMAIPVFEKKVRKHDILRDVFFRSGLVHACEQLIGENCVTLRENIPTVSYLLPNEEFIEKGMSMTAPYPRKKWELDKPNLDYRGLGADCNFMVGIALSKGQDQDENSGQFVVWPGSHMATHAAMSETLREEGESENILPAFRKKNIDIGDPRRVPLQPGDVVLIHQRTGIAQGINLTDKIRKMLFFRVVHISFDELLEEYTHTLPPFVGYDPIQEIVSDVLG